MDGKRRGWSITLRPYVTEQAPVPMTSPVLILNLEVIEAMNTGQTEAIRRRHTEMPHHDQRPGAGPAQRPGPSHVVPGTPQYHPISLKPTAPNSRLNQSNLPGSSSSAFVTVSPGDGAGDHTGPEGST